MKRVIFDLVSFIVIFIFPWYISVPLFFVGIFAFDNFYEFIMANVIIYSLFAIKGEMLMSSPVFFSAILIVVFVILQYIRSNLILYKNKR